MSWELRRRFNEKPRSLKIRLQNEETSQRNRCEKIDMNAAAGFSRHAHHRRAAVDAADTALKPRPAANGAAKDASTKTRASAKTASVKTRASS